jgi:hypothetical protein
MRFARDSMLVNARAVAQAVPPSPKICMSNHTSSAGVLFGAFTSATTSKTVAKMSEKATSPIRAEVLLTMRLAKIDCHSIREGALRMSALTSRVASRPTGINPATSDSSYHVRAICRPHRARAMTVPTTNPVTDSSRRLPAAAKLPDSMTFPKALMLVNVSTSASRMRALHSHHSCEWWLPHPLLEKKFRQKSAREFNK